MKRVQAYRASKILYNFLVSNNITGKFLLPPNVCPVVPLALRNAGLDFDFIDINPSTLCMDQELLLQNANQYTGVVYVRTYGVYDELEEYFLKLKNVNPQLIIIDDSCLCPPKLNATAQSSADLVLYSLGEKKYVNLGKGAFAYMSDQWIYHDVVIRNQSNFEAYEQAIALCLQSDQQITDSYSFLENETFELDEVSIKEYLDCVVVHKNIINQIYKSNLPSQLQLLDKFQGWRFNILLPNKDLVLKSLFESSLFASSHYKSLSEVFGGVYCPNATYLSEHVINLFNDFYYTEEQAYKTCKVINNIVL